VVLPSVTAIAESVKRASDLRIVDLDDIGRHYATTLRRWYENFNEHWDEIAADGFDEQFHRLWTSTSATARERSWSATSATSRSCLPRPAGVVRWRRGSLRGKDPPIPARARDPDARGPPPPRRVCGGAVMAVVRTGDAAAPGRGRLRSARREPAHGLGHVDDGHDHDGGDADPVLHIAATCSRQASAPVDDELVDHLIADGGERPLRSPAAHASHIGVRASPRPSQRWNSA